MPERLLLFVPIYVILVYLSYQVLGYGRLWGEITSQFEEQPEEAMSFEDQIGPLLENPDVKTFFVSVMETAMGNLTERMNPTMVIPNSEEASHFKEEAQKFLGEMTGKAIEEGLPDWARPFLDRKDPEDPEAKSWRERIDENPTFAAYGFQILQNYGILDKADGYLAKLLGGKVSPGTNPGTPQTKGTVW